MRFKAAAIEMVRVRGRWQVLIFSSMRDIYLKVVISYGS
jgi:hypothetical protein